jgi:hypothetical protein
MAQIGIDFGWIFPILVYPRCESLEAGSTLGIRTVRGALRVASETSPDRPASSADDTVPTTPQDRERAPALGHAALF